MTVEWLEHTVSGSGLQILQQVMQIPESGTVVLFWCRIIGAYTRGAFEERLAPEPTAATRCAR